MSRASHFNTMLHRAWIRQGMDTPAPCNQLIQHAAEQLSSCHLSPCCYEYVLCLRSEVLWPSSPSRAWLFPHPTLLLPTVTTTQVRSLAYLSPPHTMCFPPQEHHCLTEAHHVLETPQLVATLHSLLQAHHIPVILWPCEPKCLTIADTACHLQSKLLAKDKYG